MPTLPEPSPAPVILDTDVASRSINGLLPLTLAARLAGRQYSPIQMTPEMSLDAAMPSAGAVAGIKMFIQGLSVGISAFCAAPVPRRQKFCPGGLVSNSDVHAATTTVPAAGEPGHGLGAVLRRQWPPMVEGQADVFEIICFDCGDDPGLAYCEVSPRLQGVRGSRTAEAALAASHKHLEWAG